LENCYITNQAQTNLRYWCLFSKYFAMGRATSPDIVWAGGRLPKYIGWLHKIMRRINSTLDPQTLEDVFDFLCQYNRQFGYSPTLREVSEACYMSRPNMYRYLDRLEGQGRIVRDSGIARGITIVAPCPDE
jgi:hypothetical protein